AWSANKDTHKRRCSCLTDCGNRGRRGSEWLTTRRSSGRARMKPQNNIRTLQSKRRMLEERLAAAKRLRAVEDVRFRARQAQGKLRRLLRTNLRKQEVIAALALRRGECN